PPGRARQARPARGAGADAAAGPVGFAVAADRGADGFGLHQRPGPRVDAGAEVARYFLDSSITFTLRVGSCSVAPSARCSPLITSTPSLFASSISLKRCRSSVLS